jgi:hypothetical protein
MDESNIHLSGLCARTKTSNFLFFIHFFFCRRLQESIVELCQYAVNNYPDVHQWLLAVPMMHFLSESSQPYTTVSSSTDPAQGETSYWGTNGLDLSNVQKSLSR